MLVRRLGAGFSDFSAVRTLSAGDTKLTAPDVYNVKNVLHPGPFLFQDWLRAFL